MKGGTIPPTLRVWDWRLGRESEAWEDFGESKLLGQVAMGLRAMLEGMWSCRMFGGMGEIKRLLERGYVGRRVRGTMGMTRSWLL